MDTADKLITDQGDFFFFLGGGGIACVYSMGYN